MNGKVVLRDSRASLVLPKWVLEAPDGCWQAFVTSRFLLDFVILSAVPLVPLAAVLFPPVPFATPPFPTPLAAFRYFSNV